VSVDDRSLLEEGSVHQREDGKNVYAIRKIAKKNVPVHALVLPCEGGVEPDHKNRNGLDNRRSNLRKLTRSDNNRNRRASAAHGFLGVTLHKASGLWRGYVNVSGKQISVGYFKTPDEAAAARDAKVRELGFVSSLNGGSHGK